MREAMPDYLDAMTRPSRKAPAGESKVHPLPPVDTTERDVCRLLEPLAAGYDVKPEHWVGGGDEGLSYCRDCCLAEVAKLGSDDLRLDGGWVGECDAAPFCETCQHPLDYTLTDYGVEEELNHFEEYGFDLDSPGDACALLKVFSSAYWPGEHGPRLRLLASRIFARLALGATLEAGR